MIPVQWLTAVGLKRTHDTIGDMRKLLEMFSADANNIEKVVQAQGKISYPFYRYYSNYNTNIGETIEEVVGLKFNEIIPKTECRVGKSGRLLMGTNKSKVYSDYNKKTGKKPSNYDWLVKLSGKIKCLEVKVIRAAESKPKQEGKLYELPSLLEERALPYTGSIESGNGSFQQTKAELFDYLLGVVIFRDQVDFYLVPSKDIKSGKLKITNQHRGAIKEDGSTDEGHLAVSDLGEYKIFSVRSEEELLAKENLAKYIK